MYDSMCVGRSEMCDPIRNYNIRRYQLEFGTNLVCEFDTLCHSVNSRVDVFSEMHIIQSFSNRFDA